MVTRRGFLAVCGAAIGATAIPGNVEAKPKVFIDGTDVSPWIHGTSYTEIGLTKEQYDFYTFEMTEDAVLQWPSTSTNAKLVSR